MFSSKRRHRARYGVPRRRRPPVTATGVGAPAGAADPPAGAAAAAGGAEVTTPGPEFAKTAL